MDCGPASLRMVALHYGKEYSLATHGLYHQLVKNQLELGE